MARYRGGGKSELTCTESSIESLDVQNNVVEQENPSTSYSHETQPEHKKKPLPCNTEQSFHWTLSNWEQCNKSTIRVDLASPEDISLDTDNSSKVVLNTLGTTV